MDQAWEQTCKPKKQNLGSRNKSAQVWPGLSKPYTREMVVQSVSCSGKTEFLHTEQQCYFICLYKNQHKITIINLNLSFKMTVTKETPAFPSCLDKSFLNVTPMAQGIALSIDK